MLSGCLVLLLSALTAVSQIAAKPEILIEVKVLEVERASLSTLGVPASSFVMNVTDDTARSIADPTRSKTLQSFQVTTVGDSSAGFRVASRVNTLPQALDAGVDFQVTTRVSVKREISLQLVSQVKVRRADEPDVNAALLFAGHAMNQEIVTAEGAHVVLGGFATEADAGQMAKLANLQKSPLLRYVFSTEDAQEPEIIVVLTPHIVRVPTIADVVAAPPAPVSVPVTVETPTLYTVQVGAFKIQANAHAFLTELSRRYSGVSIQPPLPGRTLYRVQVGQFTDRQAAAQVQKQLQAQGINSYVSKK